jgi:hypothetical protein
MAPGCTVDVKDREDALQTTNTSVPGLYPLYTGGHYEYMANRRISRARNTRRQKNASQNSYSDFTMELVESVPEIFDHYLSQICAGCVALKHIKSMWDSPDIFLAALNTIAAWYTGGGGDPISEDTWDSVLSDKFVLSGSPYTRLVNKLFLYPFKHKDAYMMQSVIAKKLINDIDTFCSQIFPYVHDNADKTLRTLLIEADKFKLFEEKNNLYDSNLYEWGSLTYNLHKVATLVTVIKKNDVSMFAYGPSRLSNDEDPSVWFSGEVEHLNCWPDDASFTPDTPESIISWAGFSGNYELTLRCTPTEALAGEKTAEMIFDRGTSYELRMPWFACTANLQQIGAIDGTMAWECYNICADNVWTEEADTSLDYLKEAVKRTFPGIDSVGLQEIGNVDGADILKLHMTFAGVGGLHNLFTYLVITHDVKDREDALLTTNTSVPGLYPLYTGGHYEYMANHRISRARNTRRQKNASQNSVAGVKQHHTASLLSIQLKSRGEVAGIDDRFLVGEVRTRIAAKIAAGVI